MTEWKKTTEPSRSYIQNVQRLLFALIISELIVLDHVSNHGVLDKQHEIQPHKTFTSD
jgi:hypothetical protein